MFRTSLAEGLDPAMRHLRRANNEEDPMSNSSTSKSPYGKFIAYRLILGLGGMVSPLPHLSVLWHVAGCGASSSDDSDEQDEGARLEITLLAATADDRMIEADLSVSLVRFEQALSEEGRRSATRLIVVSAWIAVVGEMTRDEVLSDPLTLAERIEDYINERAAEGGGHLEVDPGAVRIDSLRDVTTL